MNRLHLVVAAGIATLVLALLALPSPVPPGGTAATAAPAVFVVKDVTLFDGERFHAMRSVLVRDGLIEAVGETVPVPEGAVVVAGEGRTLLPGLIDAHVHVWGGARRDALRFGVTTVLDMFSDPTGLAQARAERTALVPTDQSDLWSAGTLATAPGGHGTQFGVTVPTLTAASEAPAWVADRKAEGSDYIKIVREDLHVYTADHALPSLDAGTAAALVAAAHAAGLRAVVHATAQEAARESLRDGADGLVHVFQDAPADAALVALARERGAFVVPTLSVVAAFAGVQSELADDPRVAPWLSPAQRQSLAGPRVFAGSAPQLLANAQESVRRLHAAGVAILAGTDAPNAGTAHGASMHEEIVWLTRSGLDATAALAAATSGPADAFGLADRGRIRPGMRADLLLVAGDLQADIRHTRDIVSIWKNGRALDRRHVDATVPALAAGMLGAFDDPQANAIGTHWVATSDRMAGGQSEASVVRLAGGAAGSAGALRVSGRLAAGAGPRWGGAFLNPGDSMMEARDASALGVLVLQLRGGAGPVKVMLFTGEQGSAPSVREVQASSEWREILLPLREFPGADLTQLRGIAFTVEAPEGDFAFDLDQVEIR
jgi:imidazolonepropionase-like amidohydrolase